MYRDPIYGNTDDYFTHYAAVTGKGTAFPPEGITMNAKRPNVPFANLKTGKGATHIRDITDGTSNTMLIGSVSPDRKIPWMKPEDVKFDDQFPALGETGGFATPYESRDARAGVFLISDGSVRTIGSAIPMMTLRNLITIADGQVIADFPGIQSTRRRPGIKRAQMIEIVRTDKGATARLVSRSID